MSYADQRRKERHRIKGAERTIELLDALEARSIPEPSMVYRAVKRVGYHVETFAQAVDVFNSYLVSTEVLDLCLSAESGWRKSLHTEEEAREKKHDIGWSGYSVAMQVKPLARSFRGQTQEQSLIFFARIEGLATFRVEVEFLKAVSVIEARHQYAGKTSASRVANYHWNYCSAEIGLTSAYSSSWSDPEFYEFFLISEPDDWKDALDYLAMQERQRQEDLT